MGKRVYLSYLLDEDSVVWPGEPTVRIEQDTSIRQNGYNSFKTTLPNHHGTHMDGPAHFNPDGPRLPIWAPFGSARPPAATWAIFP